MPKLTKNKLFIGILAFMLIVNLLVIFNLNQFYIRAILAFLFITLVPGLLIMLMMKIRQVGFWEYLVYTIGLSVSFIMFAGLAVNWILPWLNITDKPLSTWPILICFNIFLIAFWIIAYLRNKDLSPFKINLPKLDTLNAIMFTIPIFFPILAVLGAFILNNHGSNILTMIMLGSIAVYVFCVILFRKKLNSNIYPWAILMVSLSLLLMFSLRSWFFSGSDILSEYHVFQLTKENFHWSMSNIRHGYNACLSITILPTIFYSFLKINSRYVFKLIIQLIFLTTPLGVYLFIKRYTKNILAFLSILFFISCLSFTIDMPAHIRQEIALLFFTLMLLILFNKNITSILKKTLFLIFGFSMIISHYSTAYISLAIFLFTYILTASYKGWKNQKTKKLENKKDKLSEKKYYITGILVLLLLLFSFLWLSQLTGTSDGLIDFTHKTIKNMGDIFTEEVRVDQSSPLEQFNIFYKPQNPTPLLQNYTREIILEYENKPYINPYPSEKYGDYKPRVTYSKMIPIKTNLDITSKIYLFGEIIKKLVKVFIVVGVFYLLFIQLKKRKIDIEYIIMVFFGLFLLVLIMILPFASIDYGLFRTYQQILVLLSLPAVFGGLVIFKFLKKENYKIIIISLIFLLYFLFTLGFIPQIIGGAEASAGLNNFGRFYDQYYVHETEVKSVRWLSNNYDKNYIYASDYAKGRLFTFGGFDQVFKNILPSTVDKSAYVYVSYTNMIGEKTFIHIQGGVISYNYPTKFLNQNKNLIYNNGGSEIFK